MIAKVVARTQQFAALPDLSQATVRDLRREYSRELKAEEAAFGLGLALALITRPGFPPRIIAYELVYHHRPVRSG